MPPRQKIETNTPPSAATAPAAAPLSPPAPPVQSSGQQYLHAKLAQAQQEAAGLADALDVIVKERNDALARVAALEAQLAG